MEQQLRPTVMASRHVVASGHYLSAQAGFQILEAGGNAIDAGVATGLATCVVESEFVGFSGVAPTLIYLADKREVVTISGVGPWPRAASTAHSCACCTGYLADCTRTIRHDVVWRGRRSSDPLR